MDKQKNIQKAIIYFAVLIFLYELASFLVIRIDWFHGMSAEQNILFSQSLILVPTILFFVVTRQNVCQVLRLKKMHWATWLLIPVLVFCIEPLMTVLNAVSLLFVDNYIAGVSNALIEHHSLPVSLLLMAVLPAVIEESAYRGVILGNFREGSRLAAILIAGCLFGIMHMNFNQMAYAVVLGIVFGFVVEATGSIFSTMLAHFCINGISVVLSFLISRLSFLFPQEQMPDGSTLSRHDILQVIQLYLPVAVVGTVMAAALIFALAILNGNKDSFLALFKKQEQTLAPAGEPAKKIRIVNPVLIITVLYCLGKCIFDEWIAPVFFN